MNSFPASPRRAAAAGLAVLLALCLLAGVAAAQVATGQGQERPFGQMSTAWSRTLDRLAALATRPNLVTSEIDAARAEALEVRAEASGAAAAAREELQPVLALLAPLEQKPAEIKPGEERKPDATPAAVEPDGVKAERTRLQGQKGVLEGRVKQAELAVARADLLIQQLGRARGVSFLNALLRKMPSPFLPSTWRAAGLEFGDLAVQQRVAWGQWLREGPLSGVASGGGAVLALAGAALTVGFWFGVRWLRRRFGRDEAVAEPAYRDRVSVALIEGLGLVAVPVLALLFLLAIVRLGEPPAAVVEALVSAATGAAIALLVHGLSETALAPTRPRWRIVGLSDASAGLLSNRLRRLAWAYGFFSLAEALLSPESPQRPALNALATLAFAIGVSAFTWPVLRIDCWRRPPAAAAEGAAAQVAALAGGGGVTAARLAVGLVVAVVLGAALLGYANLADHAYGALVHTVVALMVAAVLHAVVRDLLDAAASPTSPTGRWMRGALGLEADAPLHDRLVVLMLFDLVLVVALSALVPAVWGADIDDIGLWTWRLLTGLKIGGHTISLIDIAIAVVLFVVAVTALRFGRRLVRERLLPSIHVNESARHAIDAGINYVGMLVAVLLAITTLGIDFSNLALILGALSVGIGLGLQGIANNTISGIIMLLERPVKVGDWVVVGKHEGIVRRINVRATEIETFQRAAVIVPNSEFLQTAVTNWTYADNVGRIDLPVSVAYGADPDQVTDLLLAAAKSCPWVATTPAAVVLFKQMADSGLQFELRVFLANVANGLLARNHLNRAILKSLNEAGVEIPYPQQEIRFRDIQDLRDVLARAEAGAAATPAG